MLTTVLLSDAAPQAAAAHAAPSRVRDVEDEQPFDAFTKIDKYAAVSLQRVVESYFQIRCLVLLRRFGASENAWLLLTVDCRAEKALEAAVEDLFADKTVRCRGVVFLSDLTHVCVTASVLSRLLAHLHGPVWCRRKRS